MDWGERLIRYRRLFHKYPEPGWLTFFSTIFIADRLTRSGYQVFAGREVLQDEKLMDAPDDKQIQFCERLAEKFASELGIPGVESWLSRLGHRTGIVAIMDTGKSGITRAYRFDMDALTVTESEDCRRKPVQEDFCSTRPGISHACGHDGHMSLGLALAEYAALKKDELTGNYIFIFQPAEEGVRGAFAFCHQWRFGKIDKLYCCHIGFAPEGTFVAGAKGFLATTKFDAELTGRSAHAGFAPERGRNALLAAARAIVDMEEIKRPEQGITRLNVGRINAGESRNTIPAHAVMQVETRGDTGELNRYMKEQALSCIRQAAARYDVQCRIRFQGESVSAASDDALSREVLLAATRSGGFCEYKLSQDFGASDDGAVFMEMVQKAGGQAVFMLFGTKINALHHESDFDFSEQVLESAFGVFLETLK